MIYKSELYHFGTLGMKWGIRRFQNEDGTYTEEGKKRYFGSNGKFNYKRYQKDMKSFEKADNKYIKKNGDKIYKETYAKSRPELQEFVLGLNQVMKMHNSDGSLSLSYVNKYNQKVAELMNKNLEAIDLPSGQTIKYVAKRASDGVGVYTAIASKNYDMSQLKNGVYGATGRIGYKKTGVKVQNDYD